MTVRAWATLLIRGFALYNMISNGITIVWVFADRIIPGPGADAFYKDGYGGGTLAANLIYPLIWFVTCTLLLAFSDGLIRWFARVPGESPDNPA